MAMEEHGIVPKKSEQESHKEARTPHGEVTKQ
jgi:hypothetical protein